MQATTPNASPPDFDFNLPCRYFKSTFARSLSMYNGGGGGGGGAGGANDMQCKSLDFDVGQYRRISAINGNNNNNDNNNIDNNNINMEYSSLECPPLPQRRQVVGQNEANNNNNSSSSNNNNNNSVYLESDASSDEPAAVDDKPPAIPARCPIVVAKSKSAGALNMQHWQQQQQQQQQQMLAQFRHAAIAENANASENAATAATAAIHGNLNRPINRNTLPPQPQQPQQQQFNGSHEDALGSTRAGRSRCSLSNNRRNVWPTDRFESQQQQQQQQHYQSQQQQDDDLMFAVEDGDDVNIAGDDAANATIALAKPPVAATRSTLVPHYAAGAKPPVAARTAPACTEQRLPAFKAHSDNTANVQVVLLQNQVDTLSWQLKQVETSNEMYRAVIEEIACFLDRYQTQKQQQRQLQQQQQISRSKSLYQVYDGSSNCEGHEQSTGDKSTGTSSCLRTRSTSNLIVDLKPSAIHNGNAAKSGGANTKQSSLATAAADKRSYDAINTANNNAYTTFKDFTWRRSPKKYAMSKAQAAADDLEEKLNQEAFRLSRTIHNLLNTSTYQPDLTQHRNAASANNNAVHAKVTKPPTTPTMPTNIPTTLITPAQNNASNRANATAAADKRQSRTVPAATNSLANATAAEMLFLRVNNIRDSRLSLRSSTDSSVHSTTSNSSVVSTSSSSAASTSSGKLETDEDVTPHHSFQPLTLPFKQHQHPHGSATEDESGFSSISSFQDIGVPLCSTMISNGTSTPNRLSLASVKLDTASLRNGKASASAAGLCDVVETREFACDSRNSTLKANHPGNVLGVPLQATHDMQHRWDTTTKTSYRNANKYQRFSTLSNEEAAAVLWV